MDPKHWLWGRLYAGADRPADPAGAAASGAEETRHPGHGQRVHDPEKTKFLARTFVEEYTAGHFVILVWPLEQLSVIIMYWTYYLAQVLNFIFIIFSKFFSQISEVI